MEVSFALSTKGFAASLFPVADPSALLQCSAGWLVHPSFFARIDFVIPCGPRLTFDIVRLWKAGKDGVEFFLGGISANIYMGEFLRNLCQG